MTEFLHRHGWTFRMDVLRALSTQQYNEVLVLTVLDPGASEGASRWQLAETLEPAIERCAEAGWLVADVLDSGATWCRITPEGVKRLYELGRRDEEGED